MIRVSAIEKALPDDIRRAVRDHPVLAVAGAAFLGFYLGKSHGREILSALVGVGLSGVRSPLATLLRNGGKDTSHGQRRCGSKT